MDWLRDKLEQKLETMNKFLKKTQKPLEMGLKRMKSFLIKTRKKRPLSLRVKKSVRRCKQAWDHFVGCVVNAKQQIRSKRKWRRRRDHHRRRPSSRNERRGGKRRGLNFDSPPAVGLTVSEDDQQHMIDSSTSVYGFPESCYSVYGFPLVEDDHDQQHTKTPSNSSQAQEQVPGLDDDDDSSTSAYEDAETDSFPTARDESDETGDNRLPPETAFPEVLPREFYSEVINDVNWGVKESGSASDDDDWEAFVNQVMYAIFGYENVCIRGFDF